MERVVYPAVFDSRLILNQIRVTFPDIAGVEATGFGPDKAVEMAAEAAAKALISSGTLPVPSGPGEIVLEPGQYINMVTIDLDRYRKAATKTKKTAAKKPATKKAATKKPATKKAATKKTAEKKSTTKKATAKAATSTTKKTATKKKPATTTKAKTTAKKSTVKASAKN